LKIPYKGEVIEVEDVSFFTRKEDWNEYQLQDGTIIKVKYVVAEICKLPNSDEYVVQSQTVVSVKKL